MPRNTTTRLAVAALTTVALTTAAYGQSTGTTAATADQTLTMPHPQSYFVDAAKPKGPSTGDTFLDAGQLVDSHGHKAGVLIQSCEAFFLAKRQISSCTGAITLARGQITFAQGGPETNSPTSIDAITGGTGPYRTVRGQIKFVFDQKTGALTIGIATR